MKSLLYLIGNPGAGKSTLLAAALKGVMAVPVHKPFAHLSYQGRGIQLGAKREAFSGTDALPMDVQPLVIAWLTDASFPYKAVVAEGDRLGNVKFFTAMQKAGWNVSVAVLDTPQDIADARCVERGSNQNPTWIAGRRTKTANIVAAGWPSEYLDGREPLTVLTDQLRRHPVIQTLRNVIT